MKIQHIIYNIKENTFQKVEPPTQWPTPNSKDSEESYQKSKESETSSTKVSEASAAIEAWAEKINKGFNCSLDEKEDIAQKKAKEKHLEKNLLKVKNLLKLREEQLASAEENFKLFEKTLAKKELSEEDVANFEQALKDVVEQIASLKSDIYFNKKVVTGYEGALNKFKAQIASSSFN